MAPVALLLEQPLRLVVEEEPGDQRAASRLQHARDLVRGSARRHPGSMCVKTDVRRTRRRTRRPRTGRCTRSPSSRASGLYWPLWTSATVNRKPRVVRGDVLVAPLDPLRARVEPLVAARRARESRSAGRRGGRRRSPTSSTRSPGVTPQRSLTAARRGSGPPRRSCRRCGNSSCGGVKSGCPAMPRSYAMGGRHGRRVVASEPDEGPLAQRRIRPGAPRSSPLSLGLLLLLLPLRGE